MESIIRVRTGDLTSAAGTIGGIADEIDEAITSLEHDAAQMSTQWEGEAYDAFYASVGRQILQMRQQSDQLHTVAALTLALADQYADADTAIAALFGGEES